MSSGFGTQSQVFIGYGKIPSSTLYDKVEACPQEGKPSEDSGFVGLLNKIYRLNRPYTHSSSILIHKTSLLKKDKKKDKGTGFMS